MVLAVVVEVVVEVIACMTISLSAFVVVEFLASLLASSVNAVDAVRAAAATVVELAALVDEGSEIV